jgi:hypothetical protein
MGARALGGWSKATDGSVNQQFAVGDATRCMYCDECVKVANAFKDNPEDDAAVSVRMVEDKFIFSVEVGRRHLLLEEDNVG